MQILDEMPVFYNLGAAEKREILIVVLQIVRNLDDASLIKAWQQSIARTRLFFKVLEECLILFEVCFNFSMVYIVTSIVLCSNLSNSLSEALAADFCSNYFVISN